MGASQADGETMYDHKYSVCFLVHPFMGMFLDIRVGLEILSSPFCFYDRVKLSERGVIFISF